MPRWRFPDCPGHTGQAALDQQCCRPDRVAECPRGGKFPGETLPAPSRKIGRPKDRRPSAQLPRGILKDCNRPSDLGYLADSAKHEQISSLEALALAAAVVFTLVWICSAFCTLTWASPRGLTSGSNLVGSP